MPDADSTTMIHIAGPCITFGSIQRQRCSWCGFVIVDDDLSRMAVAIPPCRGCGKAYMHGECDEENGLCDQDMDGVHSFERPSLPAGFPFEQFIEVTMAGGFRGTSVVESEPLDDGTVKVPPNSCMMLPAELTGEKDHHLEGAGPDSVDPRA